MPSAKWADLIVALQGAEEGAEGAEGQALVGGGAGAEGQALRDDARPEAVWSEVLQVRQLTRRFGPLPEWAVHRITSANRDQLEAWVDAVLDAATLEGVLDIGS